MTYRFQIDMQDEFSMIHLFLKQNIPCLKVIDYWKKVNNLDPN
jgi:hypothetical protein